MGRALQIIATFVLILLALRGLARWVERRRAERARALAAAPLPESATLRYPPLMGWILGGGAVFFAVLAALAARAPVERSGPQAAAVFVGFVLIALAGLVVARAGAVRIERDEVTATLLGRARGTVRLSTLAAVSLRWDGALRLEDRSGESVTVSERMDDADLLAAHVLERAPLDARIDPPALTVLVWLARLPLERLAAACARRFPAEAHQLRTAGGDAVPEDPHERLRDLAAHFAARLVARGHLDAPAFALVEGRGGDVTAILEPPPAAALPSAQLQAEKLLAESGGAAVAAQVRSTSPGQVHLEVHAVLAPGAGATSGAGGAPRSWRWGWDEAVQAFRGEGA